MWKLEAGIVLLMIAICLFLISAARRRRTGLPTGKVIYTDSGGWQPLEKPLVDQELGLIGKPDYIVQKNGCYIPVEVKTGRTPEAPYDSHIFQLAAYCHLVEITYAVRPTHGIIHYPQRDFSVNYSPKLESALLNLITDLRSDLRCPDLPRSHQQKNRCRSCGFLTHCDQRLI